MKQISFRDYMRGRRWRGCEWSSVNSFLLATGAVAVVEANNIIYNVIIGVDGVIPDDILAESLIGPQFRAWRKGKTLTDFALNITTAEDPAHTD